MTYYIVKGHIFTIYLSLLHLTSINFPNKVLDYVGGQDSDFLVYELNKNRSLIFEPKRKDFSRNFIGFLKDTKYHFNLKYSEKLSNKDIEIKKAEPCSYYTLLKDTAKYQLFECPKSLLFVNKSKVPIKVNEHFIKSKSFISKGPPVYLNNEMIYYNGRSI